MKLVGDDRLAARGQADEDDAEPLRVARQVLPRLEVGPLLAKLGDEQRVVTAGAPSRDAYRTRSIRAACDAKWPRLERSRVALDQGGASWRRACH